jgi:C4-dicarboxylate transporter, DctQ subunit
MLKKIIKGLDVVTYFSAMLAGMIILALILINSYAVVSRYLLNIPIDWVLDVSELLMVGCVFTGTAYAFQKGGHVCVDLVVARHSQRVKRVLGIITTSCVSLFCIILVWKTWDLFWINLNTRTSSVVQLPMSPSYFSVFYGSCLLLLQSMRKIYSVAKG